MFLFGYQCCLRKNDITQDIPTYPSDYEEDTVVSGPTLGDKDTDAPGPFTGQWLSYFSFLPSELVMNFSFIDIHIPRLEQGCYV